MLPDIPNQYPILQQWVGLGSFILVIFGVVVSWRKMLRQDKPESQSTTVANFPKYYFEGPIAEFQSAIHDIKKSIASLDSKFDDVTDEIRKARRR